MNGTVSDLEKKLLLNAGLSYYEQIVSHLRESVDFNVKSLQYSVMFVIFNPVFWNIVARLEYHTHFLTKTAGSAKRGCYLLAITIFSLGVGRDMVFKRALQEQPTCNALTQDKFRYLAYGCIGLGQLLVVTSMYQLGVTGTYLGDYFGILMKERVTGFPFNVSNNPMYQGSSLSFFGFSLLYAKPAGLLITFMVYILYKIALRFEEPFTAMIYAKKTVEEKRKLK